MQAVEQWNSVTVHLYTLSGHRCFDLCIYTSLVDTWQCTLHLKMGLKWLAARQLWDYLILFFLHQDKVSEGFQFLINNWYMWLTLFEII